MIPNLLYVSFDLVPAPKGASVHIEQFTRILAARFGALKLVTIGAPEEFPNAEGFTRRDFGNGIEQILLPAPGDNLLDRIGNFRRFLESFCKNQNFNIAHFRSPFEGMWLCQQKGKLYDSLIFEVNGLPSIELKYRYPKIAEDFVFLEKVMLQEQACFEAADLLITPSTVTENFLCTKGVEPEKIRVIPNAVDLEIFRSRIDSGKESNCWKFDSGKPLNLLYFGTLAAWQGVELAIAATASLNKERQAFLRIVGTARSHQLASLEAQIIKENADQFIKILPPCSQLNLVELMHDSDIILAPLSANDRNTVQGCCPFKVLEGMAAGVPVISTALPVVQEIAGTTPTIHLCKPGSVGSLKDAVNSITRDPARARTMAMDARARVEQLFSIDKTAKLLLGAYENLLGNHSKTNNLAGHLN